MIVNAEKEVSNDVLMRIFNSHFDLNAGKNLNQSNYLKDNYFFST